MLKFDDIILNTNEDYKLFLKTMSKYSSEIAYVVLNGDKSPNEKMINYFEANISKKVVKSKKNFFVPYAQIQYRSPLTRELLKILLEFDNLYVLTKKEIGKNLYDCKLNYTEWGFSDIAFYSSDGKIISYTTIHEGWIFVDLNIAKELSSLKMPPNHRYMFGNITLK